MNGLRKHNRIRLTYYLDKEYPDSLPGSPDREAVFESRKLESRVVAKSSALDRVDAYFKAKDAQRRGEDVEGSYSRTWEYLEYVIHDWLPEKDPIAASAFKEFLLNPSIAGGGVELQRIEDKAKEGHEFSQVIYAYLLRAIGHILDKCDEDNYRLEVKKDERARTQRQAYEEARQAEKIVRRGWMQKAYHTLVNERNMKSSDAVKLVARRFQRKKSVVYEAIKEEIPEGTLSDDFPLDEILSEEEKAS